MTLSSATATVVPDAGYDGMTKVDVDATEYGTSNYNDGVLAQKAKLTEINITENGTYTKEDGYSKVVVDVKAPTETIDLKTDIKFGYSTFSAMPFTLICDSGVTDMNSMFYACNSLTTLDVSNFDTSNVTNMANMFSVCGNLTSLDVSNFNTSNVTDMKSMFYACHNLTTVNLSNFNTINVTNMYSMFSVCGNLTTLDVSNFDTSNVTNMADMFYACNSLTTLDVSNFDTSNVTDMNYMFANCQKLTTLDLSNFNTINVTNMGYMFIYCENLTTVKVINCDESTKNKILTQLQTDLSSYTWTLGDDGIIRRSETT
nr:hypothetical protein WCOTENJF_WCOTENJF_CDS_0040 [uncultured phage]